MSELYLSRLQLDPRRHVTQRALANCHLLHQAVLAAFPTTSSPNPREAFGVLYRPEFDERSRMPTLLVQSVARPDWSPLRTIDMLSEVTAPSVKNIAIAYAEIDANMHLRFRLRANPTRRVNESHEGVDAFAGKRVEIRDAASQQAWLARKGEQCGFVVLRVQIRSGDILGAKQRGQRRNEAGYRPLTFASVIFDGVLEVRNPELLRHALWHGVGAGKAYGFGLLSVAPARG